MYTLMVSRSLGISYAAESHVTELKELDKLIEQLDKDLIRWYIEQDGVPLNCRISKAHQEALKLYQSIQLYS